MSGNVRIGVSLPKVYPRTIVRVNRLRPVGEKASVHRKQADCAQRRPALDSVPQDGEAARLATSRALHRQNRARLASGALLASAEAETEMAEMAPMTRAISRATDGFSATTATTVDSLACT